MYSAILAHELQIIRKKRDFISFLFPPAVFAGMASIVFLGFTCVVLLEQSAHYWEI